MSRDLDTATEMLSPGVKLPDFFPSVLPPCKEVAAEFFFCFSNNSPNNRMVPAQALMPCYESLQAYKDCMTKAIEEKNKQGKQKKK